MSSSAHQHQPPPSLSLSTSPRQTMATTATSTATATSTSRSASPPTSLSHHSLQQHQQLQQNQQDHHHQTQTQPQPQQQQQHPSPPLAPLYPHLPSPSSERHVAEARAAVVASIGNMLDSQLQTRASVLHDNAAALDRQERDVLAATEGLRRERERLAREADAAARKVKELGNVQNWAEVLERGFLVLEETVRLANGGSDRGDGGEDGDEDGSGGGSSCSCSCSECGREDHGHVGPEDMDLDADGDVNGGQGGPHGKDAETDAMAVDADGTRSAWSDTSRSLMEPESSTGTGRAKGSDTASLSTGSSSKDVT
ncbi:GCN5-like 1 [Purpureocillium lilacinum]|uniref:Biogenesis of lysosome-related organelles complex 1 subunit 1 n=1 Tax=Purpureocillium lilacinum TaxID=33203 RepID=A0A179GS51_PURLI|nr:GCN5-like 1 [Purpureocillium lilacinum]